jgi:hypothetical protein
MNPLPEDALQQAATIFLVANTPPYLYKRLRENALVARLNETKTSAEIIELIRYYAGDGAGRPESPVAIYACLVALSFKPLPEFQEFLMAFDTPLVRWLPQLRGFILAERGATQSDIHLPGMVSGSQTIYTSTATTQGIAIDFKPRVIASKRI